MKFQNHFCVRCYCQLTIFSMLFILLVLSGTELFAVDLNWVGARSLGLAGASGAVSQDATAIFWNPALAALVSESIGSATNISKQRHLSVSYLDLIFDQEDLMDPFESASEFDIYDEELISDQAALAEFVSDLEQLAERQPMLGLENGGLMLVLHKYFFLSAAKRDYRAIVGKPDLIHISPELDSENSIFLNDSEVDFWGLKFMEYSLGSAYGSKSVYFGSRFSYIDASSYYNSLSLFDLDGSDAEDLLDRAASENRTDDDGFTGDIGVIFRGANSALGVVARNLMELELESPISDEKINLEPNYTVSFSYGNSGKFLFAADWQFEGQDPFNLGYDDGTISAGLEAALLPPVIVGRIGVHDKDESFLSNPLYAAGVSLNFEYLALDLALTSDQYFENTGMAFEVSLSF